MATFSIEYAQGTPDIARQPRANLNVDTGGQAIGQAFAGLGERLFQFGEKKQQAQNALDLSKQKRLYDETNLAAYNALQNVTDDAEAEKILSQYRQDIGSLKTGNSAVDSQFEMHVNDTITGVTDSFGKRLETNKIKKLNDEFDVNYSGLLSSGNFDGASELIGNMKSSGAITSVKAEGLRKTFVADSFLQQTENKINQGSPASLENAGGMLDALSKQDKVKLTADQLDKMDNLRTNLLSAQNRAGSAMKEQQDKEEWDLFKKASDGVLKREDLDASVVDAQTKRIIWNEYQTATSQIASTGQSAIMNGTPQGYAEMLQMIDLHPEQVTKQDIFNNRDVIGIKNLDTLVDRLERNQTESNPVAKKSKAEISRLLNLGLFGDKDSVETSDKHIQMVNTLDNFLKTGPTEQQTQTFMASLIRENKDRGWIKKLFGIGTPEVSTTQLLNQRKAEIQTQQVKTLDTATAQAILAEAGGDKKKAREIAIQRGYKL